MRLAPHTEHPDHPVCRGCEFGVAIYASRMVSPSVNTWCFACWMALPCLNCRLQRDKHVDDRCLYDATYFDVTRDRHLSELQYIKNARNPCP